MEQPRTWLTKVGLVIPLCLALTLAIAGIVGYRLAPPASAAGIQDGGIDSDAPLKTYQTRYYTIYTDLDPDQVREAALRMTKMAEEYHARTAAFSGQITQRLPFYLFKTDDEYYEAGAPPGSAGVFTGMALMATADAKHAQFTWHIIQHEGFHQFAHAVIGGQLPIWVNEGVAEYFGESLFTGDGFVTGLIPPDRLKRIKDEITKKDARSIKDMMLMDRSQWNAQLRIINYDQAWSMVHFLINANNGKYQQAFSNFMLGIGRGMPWDQSWMHTFGTIDGFEQQWHDWWLAQSDDPTGTEFDEATCETLTSFLVRAQVRRQTFKSFSDFTDAATSGELKLAATTDPDWLPPDLLKNAMAALGRDQTKWSFAPPPGKSSSIVLPKAKIMAELPDGTRIIGNYIAKGSHAWTVSADIDDLIPAMANAQKLADDGKKQAARTLLQASLHRNPTSPSAGDARKMMAKLR
jgi:hypothetical protein